MYLFAIVNPVLSLFGSGDSKTALQDLISTAAGFLLIVGVIAAFLYLLIGALKWITSSGDKQKLQEAQEQITQAITGLIVLAAVWAVMILLQNFLGFSVLQNGQTPTNPDTPGPIDVPPGNGGPRP